MEITIITTMEFYKARKKIKSEKSTPTLFLYYKTDKSKFGDTKENAKFSKSKSSLIKDCICL